MYANVDVPLPNVTSVFNFSPKNGVLSMILGVFAKAKASALPTELPGQLSWLSLNPGIQGKATNLINGEH